MILLMKKLKKQYHCEYRNNLNIWENLEKIYDVLVKLGFVPTDGDVVIPEITIDNLRKK